MRLDLNEAPGAPGGDFRSRVLASLERAPWHRYPAMDGGPARESAAQVYGWHAGGTLVGNGSNALLAAAVRALLPRGGCLAVLWPSFSMYPVLAHRQGATLAKVSLSPPEFAADPEDLVAAVAGADIAVLCSPNNPTGSLLAEEVWAAVLATGRPVIWDAAYHEFAGSLQDPASFLARHPNLLVLRSLSKAWGLAGLRIGALLGGGELLDRVTREVLPFEIGWLADAAYGAAASCREEGARLVGAVCGARERLRSRLGRLPGVEVAPSAANFVLVRRAGWNGRELAAALARRDIAVREVQELTAAGFVRVTVGDAVQNDALLAALGEVSGG